MLMNFVDQAKSLVIVLIGFFVSDLEKLLNFSSTKMEYIATIGGKSFISKVTWLNLVN